MLVDYVDKCVGKAGYMDSRKYLDLLMMGECIYIYIRIRK